MLVERNFQKAADIVHEKDSFEALEEASDTEV